MLNNYLKIAFRALYKFKAYTTINLAGLALALMAGVLIMTYVFDELSYDRFHTNIDRVYRVNTNFRSNGETKDSPNETNGWPIGKILERDYPEVEAVLYLRPSSLLITHEQKNIRQNLHYASTELFSMFTFPLVQGNKDKALTEPFTVVISEDMEKKYFESGKGLNKVITMNDTLQLVVTGVMKNIPTNSHIQADMFISFSTYEKVNPDFSYNEGWGNINMHNYVLLKNGSDFTTISEKVKDIYNKNVSDMLKQWGVSATVELEPVKDIYLRSRAGNGIGPKGSIDRVYMLSGIAVFVILLGCINFINLATARSVYRAKEVGLRKVVGSSRKGLIAQFLSESFLLTSLALVIALAGLGILLPFFNSMLGKSYTLLSLANIPLAGGILGLVIIVTLLAGYYPSLVMSALRPAEVLKGKMQTSKRGVQLRRTLVIFQFVVSASLVAGTIIVIDQLHFMQQQSLGFDKDQVLVLNAARVKSSNPDAFETFMNQLQKLSAVEQVTFTNALPGTHGWTGQVAYPEGKAGDGSVSVEYMAVDDNYIKTLGLQLIAGNGFDKGHQQELKEGLILNETAVAMFGWANAQEAIGKKIDSPSSYPAGEVIGVVKDYHQLGLQQKIGPVAMDYAPQHSYLYAIRFKAANTQALIENLHQQWKAMFPGYDFTYFFLDESFERQYQGEERLANVLALFAVITIVIAVIGLLGLVSFMVAARTKEIGVRKVLGADVLSITRLLSKEFIGLVMLANVIAVPLVWYSANQWLENFAFRMEISAWLFIMTTLIALVITVLVVSGQTIKAALTDPVKSLRYE